MKRRLHRLSLLMLAFFLLASIFFALKARERDRLLDELIDVTVASDDPNDRDRTVASLSNEIYNRTKGAIQSDELDWYSRIESTSFFNVTSAVSLKYGGFGIAGHSIFGPCGTMSRTLMNALWRLDIPARKLHLLDTEIKTGGHTMIEYYADGAWRVLSPSDSTLVWRTDDGQIATALQIRESPGLFSQALTSRASYPYSFDNHTNIRWEKLPNWMVSIIRSSIGESRFKTMKTPRLYDLPRSLLLYASLSMALTMLGAAGLTRSS